MKIYSVTPLNLQSRNSRLNKNNNQIQSNKPQENKFLSKLPSTEQYLASFTGGYSLDLEKTVKQLDKLAEQNSSIYPPNIREWAGMILENGNKTKETLISIHKKYFASLKDCFNLDEIKEKFPEFNEVQSSVSVKASNNSFLDRFQKGEFDYFDNNEDLSVQLIKLYWGEGFSLSDLKQYAGGQDLYYAMKRLNIPTASRDYGHVLKFSEPDYNKRLTLEMSKKCMEKQDRLAQINDGEPVYIPRGPLSAAHKKHISEGLIRYWQENPERIFSMSERQKDFYRNNPEKSEELSRVMHKAWSISSADRIKNAMSKFMKARGIQSFDPETNPVNLSKEQSKLLKNFWDTNEWAKKLFSKNVTYAWKKVKEENETVYYLKNTPTALLKFIEKKAGVEPGTLNTATMYNPYLENSSIDDASQKILYATCKDMKGLQDIMADTYQLAVFTIIGKLKDIKPTNKNKPLKKLQDFTLFIAHKNLKENGKGYKIQYTEEAQQDFIQIAAYAAKLKSQEAIDLINRSLDESFEFALSVHPEFNFADAILK